MNWYIWIVAALAYVIFAAWYFNWKGVLKPNEIEQYILQVQKNSGGSPTDPEVLRKFMESDDGKEFVMLNLIRFNAGDVAHPLTAKYRQDPNSFKDILGRSPKYCFARAGTLYFWAVKKAAILTVGIPLPMKASKWSAQCAIDLAET